MILSRKSGLLFTALYLKQCGVSLQKCYGGIPEQHSQHSTMVSLTRSGYPRIIPAHPRRMMRQRDEKADKLVKLYLSWFTLSKIILLAKPVSKDTLASIRENFTNLDGLLKMNQELTLKFPGLMEKYIPWISTIPVEQGIRWTWKSLPNTVAIMDLKGRVTKVTSCFLSFYYELVAFGRKL